MRFGAYHLYLPALLKPAPRTLATQLWALRNGGLDQPGIDEIAHLAQSGRTSIPVDPAIAHGLYRAAGFRVCGGRAVRVDILERLADLIRPAIAYRPGMTPGEPPPGAADGDGFVGTVAMTSLVGCAGEDFASILKSLGYVVESRPGPAITVPLVPAPTRGRASGAGCRARPLTRRRPPRSAAPARRSAEEVAGEEPPEASRRSPPRRSAAIRSGRGAGAPRRRRGGRTCRGAAKPRPSRPCRRGLARRLRRRPGCRDRRRGRRAAEAALPRSRPSLP